MSVERFIAELEQRKLLSGRLVDKLRDTVVSPERPLSAKSLAKFLVQKKHLSQQQATDVLNELSAAGVDLNATSLVDDQDALAADERENESPADDGEGSSIFAPYLTGRRNKKPEKPPVKFDDGNELRIVSTDEPVAVSRGADRSFRSDDAPAQKESRRHRANEKTTVEAAVPDDATSSQAPHEPRVTKATRKKLAKKQWDSPLILIGGGGLLLLLLSGATIWWLLIRETGDQKLQLAEAAKESGAYTQAIEHYQSFLESSPRHPGRSAARVNLATVQIRQATEAANYSAAFDTAQKELEAVEDEDEFPSARGELAALLPRIALGLAQQAEQAAAGSDEALELTELANKALALCNNATYITKEFRDEGKLKVVRETLQRVERHQQTTQALKQGISEMEQAIAAGKTSEAYLVHKKLNVDYPELVGNTSLAEMVSKASAAEQTAIRFVAEEQAAQTADRPTPWVAALAVAHRRGTGTGAPQSGAICVRVEGAAYGLDAATGRVLWRRQIGYASAAPPLRVGGDVLITDAARQELVCLSAATGALRWRQTIGEPFAMPLVVGERGFVAANSGKLFVIDLKSGVRTGFVQFAQPLRVTPAANPHQQRLYIAGDHSVLYSISLADLSCAGVYHLGHAQGSIRVQPALVLDKLAVLENDGVETSRLHLLTLDGEGNLAKDVADRRLTGSPTSAPLVLGRRMLLVTDRGQMEVYDIGSGDSSQALTLIASRAATGKQPVARHAAVMGNHIWVGDSQLTKFTISPTGNRLPVESIENDFSGATFDHPFLPAGNTLIHVHRPKGRTGFVVAATDTAQGKVVWETQLAMPPAGAAIVDAAGKALAVANAEGFVFRFDEAAIRSRVQDQPLASQSRPTNPPALTTAVNLGQGRAAFCAAGFDQLLFYDPTHGAQSRWVKLATPLAAAVTPMGNGLVAPLTVGQVFYLSAADGTSFATPFQPRVQPGTAMNYAPAGIVDAAQRRFVISDGREKVYLVAAVDQPSPHLEAVAEAGAGPYPIQSRMIVLGDVAIGIGGESHVARFQLPSLEPAGVSNLSAPVVWGPFSAQDAILLATADGQLVLVSPTGEELWRTPLDHGDLAGEPLIDDDNILLAFRNGVIERRAKSDGKPAASVNVEHSLAAGPVDFLGRIVVTAADGTLLVVDRP